jgi:hypothetical protein
MEPDAFVESLVSDTAAALQRSGGDVDSIRGAVFLYLSRAYDHGLEPDRICDLLGVAPDSVLNRAGLSRSDEAAVMAAYEALDPVLEQQYRPGDSSG